MTRRPSAKLLLMALLLTAALPSTTAAVTRPTTTKATPAPSATDATKLTNLMTRGSAEIDRRVANLNAALAKLQATTKLTAADKAALVKQIQDELTGLTALKTKLAADTTLATARTDVQSIVTDYRVYVLMLPKTRLVAADDSFTVAEGKLSDLASRLQTRLTAAQSNGHNVDALEAALTDLNAKLTDATAKTNGLVSQLLALQPSDYNANHAALLSFRQALGTADTDLKAARADAATIISGLKGLS